MPEDSECLTKMPKETRDAISRRLIAMVGFAKARSELPEQVRKDLAKKHQYIRIGGKGFRAISVSKDHPLIGYKGSTDERIKTILSQFNKDDGLPSKPLDKNKKREERRLQSLMIRSALSKKNRLDGVIGCKSSGLYADFDEIHFALDEVSLGDSEHKIPLKVTKKGITYTEKGIIRCDILAVGIKGSKAHPILIELKYNRSQARLLDQLGNFSKLITHDFQGEFENLFKACLGRSVDCGKCYQFLIWPKPKGKKRVDKLKERMEIDVKVIEYQYEQNADAKTTDTCTMKHISEN